MKTNPEVLKVLVALAKNLRSSARNVREKTNVKNNITALPELRKHLGVNPEMAEIMRFQAAAMHHALYNAFFIAKKAAGRI